MPFLSKLNEAINTKSKLVAGLFWRVFSKEKIDAVILEVGLGGRLDAVNVLDADCTVLTSVGIDHVEYLGDNREAIGREKAGIFRAGRPAVVADPDPPQSVLQLLR